MKMTKSTQFWGIVPAAGVGKRMNANCPKQYLQLSIDKATHSTVTCSVIEHTLSRLIEADMFEKIVVAISTDDAYWPDLPLSTHTKVLRAQGGKERADSVLNALLALDGIANADDWVLVHDAARPCITKEDIHLLISTLRNDDVGGILALSSHDTLKEVHGNHITSTLDRNVIWRALTPQMFRYGVLKKALEASQGSDAVTDEASALEMQGFTPKIVEGRSDNIKITRPEDLALAQFYLTMQHSTTPNP